MTLRAVVKGVGHYLPERVVPNAEFEATLDSSNAMGAVVSSGPWELYYHLMRAAALAELDRGVEAQAAIDAAIVLNPSLSLTTLQARFDRSQNHPENRALWLAALEEAGLPYLMSMPTLQPNLTC